MNTDLVGSICKSKGTNTFIGTFSRWIDGSNQISLGIATKRILQNPRQLTIAVRNMHKSSCFL